MREKRTANGWIAQGYKYVYEGTQGKFDFVRMDEYDFEDFETKKNLRFESGFDVEGYGLKPATANDLFSDIPGLEDVIRGLKKHTKLQLYRNSIEEFALVAKIFRTNTDAIEQLVDEYELKEEEK